MTDQERAQELKTLTDKLEQGIRNVFESGRMKEYLSAMSRMPTYSARNMALIFLQRPDASKIMGYTAWKNDFGRQVNLGEKGIRILAPAPYKTLEWQDRDKDGNLYLDSEGKPKPRRVEITHINYKAVSVFDVAQTSGKELPTLVSPLVGDVPDYTNFFKALERSTSYPIEFQEIKDTRRGYCSFTDKKIVIGSDQSELQTVKTAIHEITHARLHERTYDPTIPGNRERSEMEAEGTAFAVCQHFGLDTSEYSFGYIANWSRDQSLDVLRGVMDTLQRSAAELINEIDAHYAELLKEQPQIEEQKSPMQSASDLIDYYELHGTNQYHTVFGDQEKNMISNFALHNSDPDDIAQFIQIVAIQQYELKNGYVNPEMQAILDASIQQEQRLNLDTPFLPPIEVLHETTNDGMISYDVYDRSTGSMFEVDNTDSDIFPINAVNTETREGGVIGFSYEREFTFDALAYTRTMFDLGEVQTGTRQLQFEGRPGVWQLDLSVPIRGDYYYLASNAVMDHLIIDSSGEVIAGHVLKDTRIVDAADFRAAVASIRAENMAMQATQGQSESKVDRFQESQGIQGDVIPKTIIPAVMESARDASHQVENGAAINCPTVSELEARVKAGNQISLLDLAAAAKAEQPRKTPTAKRTSISEKLEKATRISQEQVHKEKSTQPKRETVSL